MDEPSTDYAQETRDWLALIELGGASCRFCGADCSDVGALNAHEMRCSLEERQALAQAAWRGVVGALALMEVRSPHAGRGRRAHDAVRAWRAHGPMPAWYSITVGDGGAG